MMTGSQMKKEKDEFTQIINAYKETLTAKEKPSKYETYTSASKQPQNPNSAKLEAFDWKPDRLLLIRFGLQDISKRLDKIESKQSENVPNSVKFVKGGVIGSSGSHNVQKNGDSYFNQISEQFKLQDGKEEVKMDDSDDEQSKGNEIKQQLEDNSSDSQVSNKEQLTGKPPKSLFESIFNNEEG